ncbi:hypothetical protein AMATHDRAFT_4015 [Amanita thiersii Skay4041]|uniref:Survival protein SurE-like phosphatase/nucleotidase domain-containing protein n=1 Tax=Amanita thiersii Skay4041 TaxID=703135 RepID=A0A2A9NRS7_9AGAR|nr:hypothetical protein AMATHDRAFT_4015 [Amanita thiersii Skay4041]
MRRISILWLGLLGGLLAGSGLAQKKDHHHTKIVLTNDDGWAVAQIRAEYDALKRAGYDVILSAPALNKSGSGSSSAPPVTLATPCQFNTCPAGSPPEGADPDDHRLNYVNSFPVDAVRFGIQTLAPKIFHSPPDFIISGSNVGNSLGTGVRGSGTVLIIAACEAALENLPSIAFSGRSVSQVSYTTLTTDPESPGTLSAQTYASLILKFIDSVLSGPQKPFVPRGTSLNINFGSTVNCTTPDSFAFVMTRLVAADNTTLPDVKTCGTARLPVESTLINQGCFVTVTVLNATTKSDVDAATQGLVLEQVSSLMGCA